MPVCKICSHEESQKINEAIVRGVANRRIAAQYGISESAVRRHKKNHLPGKMILAHEAAEVANAESLVEQLKELQQRTLAILSKAESALDLPTALKAIAQARGNLELAARLAVENPEAAAVNVKPIIDALGIVAGKVWVDHDPANELSKTKRKEDRNEG